MKSSLPTEEFILKLKNGDRLTLSHVISWVENDLLQGNKILHAIKNIPDIPVIGITGPPGAGKSSLINWLIVPYFSTGKKIAVLAIDPSSPFSGGSVLGDRIRMSQHVGKENIFIRSLATRGKLGGISSKTVEIIELLKFAGYDLIIVETAGIGQSEMDISYISDVTVLVLVPDSGDEIQIIKSGIMEAADIIVVNKSDREGTDAFVQLLLMYLKKSDEPDKAVPVMKTIATQATENINDSHHGIQRLAEEINQYLNKRKENDKKSDWLKKAVFLLQKQLIGKINVKDFENKLINIYSSGDTNLFKLVDDYINEIIK